MCEFSDKVDAAKAAISAVSAQQARDLQASGVTFVDPRPQEAIASTTGIIPGAVSVPLADIEAGRLPAALADKSGPVITACQAGPMGAIAAHALSKLGFSQVHYIEGGTQGWLAAGYPTNK